MLRNLLRLASFLVFSSLLACHLNGDPISIFGTGQAVRGNALPVGAFDPHFSLVSAPNGVWLSTITTSPNGLWTRNTLGNDWISPGASGDTGWPVGTYDYRMTFSLTGFRADSAELVGGWASDNNGCILLNGANTGACTHFEDFGHVTPFSISNGFDRGTNTLDFVVYNGGGPTGLFVDVKGTADSAVPEPSSLILIGSVLSGAGLALRWKLNPTRSA